MIDGVLKGVVAACLNGFVLLDVLKYCILRLLFSAGAVSTVQCVTCYRYTVLL